MQLNDTDFQLFDVPATFAQDRATLDARWKELQREAHPDRFAAQGAAAQRVAMQWSVRINEAYQRLKNPIKRATYLCQLNGSPIRAETNTAMPAEFLADQMEKRELLEQAVTVSDWQRVIALSSELRLEQDTLLGRIERQLEAQGWNEAAQTLRQLKFLEKFGEEIGAAEEKMDS